MLRKSKIVLALSLVLVLSLSLVAPVSLAEDTKPTTKAAAITKLVKTPLYTNAPVHTFKFEVKPFSFSESTDTTVVSAMPKAHTADSNNVVTISFTEADAKADCECESTPACATDINHYYKELTIFDASTVWNSAGVYWYNIKELPTAFNAGVENIIFTGVEYNVKVYVKQNEVSGAFEIDYITSRLTKNEAGETGPTVEKKIDPNPGGNTSEGYKYSQLRFTNKYAKHNGGAGTDPKTQQTFVVEKNVTGNFSETSRYFDFSITLIKHEYINSTAKYRVYIIGSNNELVSNLSTYNGIPSGGNNYYDIDFNNTPSATLIFKLKDKEKLVFTNAYVGTIFTITETGVIGYEPKATVTISGSPHLPVEAAKGSNLTIPNSDDKPLPLDKLRIGDKKSDGTLAGANMAQFLNTNELVTDTGLNITDLPFYSMIFLALAGLVTFVILKARSRKNTQ